MLTAFGPDGAAVAQWFLEAAWPAKLEVDGVTDGTGQALTETVTLTARKITRSAP